MKNLSFALWIKLSTNYILKQAYEFSPKLKHGLRGNQVQKSHVICKTKLL